MIPCPWIYSQKSISGTHAPLRLPFPPDRRNHGRMSERDPFVREKFTKEWSFARKRAREYFEKYPKDRYNTEAESWRKLQSDNIEFTMKRLPKPKA
jgi:hypothetical protein